jgi:class 3 adenylate cyclase/predicted ATPase
VTVDQPLAARKVQLDQAWAAVAAAQWTTAAQLAESLLSTDPDDPDAAAILRVARHQSGLQPPVAEASRRQISVMFCDVVGSTAMSTVLDPEVMHEVVVQYQQTCADVVEGFGGHIADYLGDGLLVFFGHPQAHEDDTRRAVLAGLAIIDAISAVSERLERTHGVQLALRVGIHTGTVMLGEVGRTDRLLAFGEVPNTAARVQSIATENTVAVTDTTRSQLHDQFVFESMGKLGLKGIPEPIEIHRVLATLQTDRWGDERLRTTPLIGRTAELQALQEAWERTVAGRLEVVILSGEAGIGKTKLIEELRATVEKSGQLVLLIQCSPYDESTGFSPIRRFIERAAGIVDGQDPASRLARIEELADQGGVDDPDRLFLLTTMIGLPSPPGFPVPPLTPDQIRERTFSFLMNWLRALSSDKPVLVVVEDLHWADPSTLELIRRILDQAFSRVMLAMTTRPDVGAPEGIPAQVLPLLPLPVGDGEKLIEFLEPELSPALRQRVAERGDGIPLYIEELVRTVSQGDSATQHGRDIPLSLQSLFQARLDQYPAERPLAQLLATVGHPVTVSLLGELANLNEAVVVHQLDALVGAQICRADHEAPEPLYTFEHALLGDAAYEMQLHRRRRDTHRRVAEVLKARYAAAGKHRPDVLAHHYQAAGMASPAAMSWLEAGQQMAAMGAYSESLEHCRRALVMTVGFPDEVPVDLELDIQMTKATALVALEGYASEGVRATYERAYELCSVVGDRRRLARSLIGLWMYHTVRANHEIAAKTAEEALANSELLRDRESILASKNVLGYQATFLGNFRAAEALHSEVAEGWVPGTPAPYLPHDTSSAAWVNLASVRWILGRPHAARQAMSRAREVADSIGPPAGPFTRAYVASFECWYRELIGDLVGAMEAADREFAISAEHGFMTWLANSHLHQGMAKALGLEPEAGVGLLTEWIAVWRGAGSNLFAAYFMSGLANGLLLSRRPAEALAKADEALALADQLGEQFFAAELHRLRGEAVLALHPEQPEGAASAFEQAVAIARAQQARAFELKAITALHRLRARQSRADETEPRLRQALDPFLPASDEPITTAGLSALGVQQ